jgi:integrase
LPTARAGASWDDDGQGNRNRRQGRPGGGYRRSHACATPPPVAWLDAGEHIKAVADLLGHSSIAITGDVYGHTSEDTARAAVDGLAGSLAVRDLIALR